MFQRLALVLALTSVVFSANTAYATIDCSQECPSGEVKSGYLDGQHTTCSCSEPGAAMEDFPADGNPPSGGEGQET